MFNVQCGPMTNKEYQIFPAGSATVDIELTFSSTSKKRKERNSILRKKDIIVHIVIVHISRISFRSIVSKDFALFR